MITVDLTDGGKGFRIASSGHNARLSEATAELIVGSPDRPVDAHAIQPLYTGILARDCGLALSAAVEPDVVVLTAL
jgi:histidine phosphotransferase ChpT